MYIQTVRKKIKPDSPGIIDAHVHVWIKPEKSITKYLNNKNILLSDNYPLIKKNLINFKQNGGNLLVDCTPYNCGRDGNKLSRLSEQTGVDIVCVTGFHKKEYYFSDDKIWNFNTEQAAAFFLEETIFGLKECRNSERKVLPGLIKIPFTGTVEGQYKTLTDAAIIASLKTGLPILVHTEAGRNAEWFADYLEQKGIKPEKVAFNHMDKRADFELHKKLAARGYFLEYDTFLREKYNPEKNTYPLLDQMISCGLGNSIMIGSDIFNNDLWSKMQLYNGYGGFFKKIQSAILDRSNSEECTLNLTGGNAGRFLSN